MALDFLDGNGFQRAGRANPRIVDQDVDAAHQSQGVADGRPDRVRLRDIERQRNDLFRTAPGAKLFRASGRGAHAPSLLQEVLCRSLSNAA